MAFFGFRWTPGDVEAARAAKILVARLGAGWSELLAWRGLLVLARDERETTILADNTGFVFGRWFERDGAHETDPHAPCHQMVDPVPGWVNQHWGGYIAVLVDRGFDIVRVLRDPSGARSCYFASMGAVNAFFSDAQHFVALKADVAPDLSYVRAFLAYPPYRAQRTGLVGVEELAPGACLEYGREKTWAKTYWTPLEASRSGRSYGWEDGKAALRAAAETAAQSWVMGRRSVALRLSGGFDSSVVLGLLRKAGAATVCVNEFWEGAPEGDERAQARAVAAAHGLKLREFRFDPTRVDYSRALGAPVTARPTLSILGFGNPGLQDFYRDLACDLITSGQGGDHLFHRSRTAWIAADALKDGVAPKALMRIALDTARLTGQSVWAVLATMMRAATGARPAPHRQARVLGLKERGAHETDDESSAQSVHAWLDALNTASPARALRIVQLTDTLAYFDEPVLSPIAAVQPLLLSQPIIETCLAIAPYVMTRGGKERALARAAFADLAPAAVTERTSKGETTRFFAQVLAANRGWVASVLLDGRLVGEGLIEQRALKAALAGAWGQHGLVADSLYSLIAAECWLRNLEQAKGEALARQN